MSVTIDEMHIEVQQQTPPSAAGASSSSTEPKKDVDLREALHLLHERKLRLRAD